MMKQLQTLLLIVFLLSYSSTSSAQSSPAASPAAAAAAAAPASPITGPVVPAPPADAPAPPGPTNITKILEKAGGFNVLIRLLKSTQVDNQLYSQLNNSDSQLTFLAPNDAAFSKLETGSLNSLSDEQKVQLLQFHLIPDFLTVSNFQTLSNPVRTQAGDGYQYPLNITTSGKSVNISTGLVNTSISGTVYSDNQLAIYQVDSVLQPFGVFAPKLQPPSPAPAPEEEKPKKRSSSHSPVQEVKSAAASVSTRLSGVVPVVVAAIAVFLWRDC